MEINKDVLKQYGDLLKEQEEVQEKIQKNEKQIAELEERIRQLFEEGTVKDRVYGGEGGIQGFNIEGFPSREYYTKLAVLAMTRNNLTDRRNQLDTLRMRIASSVISIEQFIMSIDDSYIRRIINLRFVHNLSWNQVADRMGGGNTEDTVRMAFTRYMEKR